MPANRVYFTLSGAPGTAGNFACSAAVSGYRSLGAADNGQSFDVFVTDGTAWEVRTDCVYTHSTATLTRGTLEESSTGSAIDLTAAAKVGVTLTEGRSSAIQRVTQQLDGLDGPLSAQLSTTTVGPQAWLPMILEAGYTSQGAAVRINGERYEFAGRIAKSSGAIASSTKVATLTAGMLVGAASTCACVTDTGIVIVTVGTDRSVTVGTVSGSPTWVDLGGLVAAMPARTENTVVQPAPVLPKITIDTGGLPIPTPTDADIDATITIDPGVSGLPGLGPLSFKFRGHGNSTWNAGPKKPYKVKFNTETSVFGWPANKSFRLLANWYDQTFLRNEFAFDIARRTTDTWASKTQACELWVNGEYKGLYQFAEAVSASPTRLPVTLWASPAAWNTGTWMLEISNIVKSGDTQAFITSMSSTRFVWDDPEPNPVTDSTQIGAITSWFNAFDALLFNDTDWLNPSTGYATKIDMSSFCDWYIVQELVRNQDSSFQSSCKLYLTPDGILHMGPTWDHDLSLGMGWATGVMDKGADWLLPPAGWHTAAAAWFKRMFRDPAFTALLETRWEAAESALRQALPQLDAQARGIAPAAAADAVRWGRGGDQPARIAGARKWLSERLAWLSPRIARNVKITNLIINPRPVASATDYTATAGTGGATSISVSGSDNGVLGGRAVRSTWTTGSSSTSSLNAPLTSGLAPGTLHNVLVVFRSSISQTCTISALSYNSGTYVQNTVLGTVAVNAGELTTFRAMWTVPAGTNQLRISTQSKSSGMPTNEWLEICGAMLIEGPAIPDLQYADPRVNNALGTWAWSGSADASTSSGVPM